MTAGLTIRRVQRSAQGFWVVIEGPLSLQKRAAAAAEAEARRWAREVRGTKGSAYKRTTQTRQQECGTFLHTVCFGFK